MMGQVAGLTDRQLARGGGGLEGFAGGGGVGGVGGEGVGPRAPRDQRRWGGVYVRGLMLDGKRKSIEPMAARLEDGDEQCLQQFVNQSPWSAGAVRGRLAVRMSAQIAPEAWVIDHTPLPLSWGVGCR